MERDAHFWWWIAGIALLSGLAAGGMLLLIGALWYAFGLFGAVILIAAVAIAAGYVQDRREQQRNAPGTG